MHSFFLVFPALHSLHEHHSTYDPAQCSAATKHMPFNRYRDILAYDEYECIHVFLTNICICL